MRFLRNGAFFSIQVKHADNDKDVNGVFFVNIKRNKDNSKNISPIIFALKPEEAADLLARYENGEKIIKMSPHFSDDNKISKNLSFEYKTREHRGQIIKLWAVLANENTPTNGKKSFAFGMSQGEMRSLIQYIKDHLTATYAEFTPKKQ